MCRDGYEAFTHTASSAHLARTLDTGLRRYDGWGKSTVTFIWPQY